MRLRLASIVVATAILAGAYPSVQLHLAAQGKGASQAEPDTDRDGTLEVLYEDGYDRPRLKHFLRTASGRVELDFGGRRPRRLDTGSRVRARGKLRNGKLAVNPLDVAALGGDVAALDGDGGSGGSTQSLASPYTFGAQPTLVILFNFSDLVQQPYTTASANTVTFTDTNNFDLENSFNQTSLSGTVVGWYTIASSATAQGCDYNTWTAQAEAAATAAGLNLNLYPRRVFGFPQTSACAWWGLGTVGGGGTSAAPSRAWINGTYSLRVVAHEMGHNFGLNHSQSRTCDTSGCFVDEYGDDHDVMGGGPGGVTGHFNAYQKERLGWLNYGTSPSMTNVNGTGQYALEPYAKPWTGGAKALKIVRATGTSNTYLYREMRTQFGVDATLPPGIVIHTGNDADGSQIFEEDVQPTAPAADFILDPGQSITFSDAVPPVTIETLTATGTGATLQITQACMYSLGSSGQSFGDTGGPGSVALTTGTNCTWTATSDSAWLTVNGGSGSGTGSATIGFTVAANPGTARTGTLTIGGQTFTVTQAANACLFTVTPLNPSLTHFAASNTLSVTATPSSCSWTAVSNDTSWLTITAGASGTGNGTVTYATTSNAGSHVGRTGTISIPGQTVTVFQEGLAATFISPTNGAINVKTTNVLFAWQNVAGFQSYRLTIGTTVGAADVYDSGEVTATNRTVPSMPTSRLLYARLRTTWPDAATPKQDITFTTVDRISGLQVLGSQSSNPVVAGGSTQYGASAANSVKVSFTGSQGNCTATFGANGLPAGATATFAPTSATSSATDQFTLLTVSTTTATVPANYTFNVTAQESAACNSPATTVTVTGVPLVVFGSTSLSTATATGTYGGSAAVSATLTAGGTPVSGKSLSFTLNGNAVGSATTNASGVATLASASLAGVNAGSFPSGVVASFAGDANYGASSANNSLTVSQKSITPSVTAGNKTYDGTSAAAIGCTLTGVVGSDVVACVAAGSFDTADVGIGKTVTANAIVLSGPAAGNYALATTTATTVASITAIEVTPSISVASKIYDGTIAADMICTVTGVIDGDVVTCDGVALFDSAIVGAGKLVMAIDLTLEGPQAGNYDLSTTTATTTADISSVALTAAATVASRLYNGTTTATLTSCTLTGVVTDDIVTCSGAATFDTASIGTGKPVTIANLTLGGPSAQNYYLTSTTTATTAAILALSVTPAITVASKAYDRTTAATLTSCTLAGQAGVADSIAVVWDPNPAGDSIAGYWVRVGTAPDDYQQLFDAGPHPYFFYPNPVPGQQYYFAVTAYNDTGIGQSSEVSGSTQQIAVPSGDAVGCAGTAAFDTASAGAGKTVSASGLALTGAASSNYALTTTTATTTAAITGVALTQSITAANKTYDGTSAAAIGCTLTGVVAGDVVSCNGTGSFASAAVGTGKAVTSSNVTLGGAQAGNYTLSSTIATTTANITAATLTPAIIASNKAYNGTSSAAITCSVTGVIGSDVVTCSGTGSFASAAVGTGKAVTSSNLTLGGAQAGNYTLSSTSATTTANITAAALTPAITASNKAYNSTSAAAISCTLTGIIGSDVVTCSGTGSFASAAVGTGKTVTSSNVTLGGAQASNYTLSSTSATTTANITAATLTPAIAASNKVYDGTSAATITCALTGIIGSDVVTCSGTGSFASAAVGTGKAVTSSNLILGGAQAGNYTLSSTSATTTANITAATLTPAITATNKTYDGTSAAAITCTLTGIIGSDVVTCSGTGSFASVAVGTGKAVTSSNVTLGGAQAGNYTLSSTSATTTANITTATLTPAIIAANKAYNGTSSATITCSVTGVIGSDVVTCSGTGSFASAAVGTGKAVTSSNLILGGAQAGNYTLSSTSATTTANITAATLTPAITATNKTYDGTSAAAITCTLTGIIGSDVVTCSGTGSFASAAVGTGKTITSSNLTLGGAQAGNYTLSSTSATTTANITAAALTPVITATNKTYDSTSTATISCTLTGVIGTEVVTCSGTGSFASASVGTGKTVTSSNLTLGGAQASSYTLASASATTTAHITTRTLTPAITAANKTYDGTSSATISCALTGIIGSDVVTCSGTGSFASAAAGTGKTVTASNLALGGAAAGNYALSSTTATTTADITAALSPSVTVSPDPAAVNATLTATVSNGPAGATDWVGLFADTADDHSIVAWCYLNGSRIAPAPNTGVSSASVTCLSPAAPGRYQVRLFANNGFTKLATSNTITVPTLPAITISDVSTTEGQTGTKTFVFTVSLSAATTLPVTVQYATSNGTAVAGTDYTAASGTLTFAAGVTSGTISVAVIGDTAFEANETFSITLSQPTNATIADPTALGTIVNDDASPGTAVALTPDPAAPGATLTATVSNTPGTATDWVGLYSETAPDNTFVDWCYLNGTKAVPTGSLNNATVTCFTAPASGRYQVRLFTNNTFTKVATSNTITVSAPSGPSVALSPNSPAVGATLSAAVSGGPATATDWVGLYLETAPDNTFVAWCYLNGTKTVPPIGVANATVPCFTVPASGRYQVRLFTNNTFTKVATSNTITVSAPSGPSVALSPNSPAVGATLSAAVSGGPATATDWVGLYRETAPDNTFVDWCYLNGTKTAPSTGVTNATVTCFTIPASGRYQVRLFSNNTFTKVTTSNTITVP